LEINQFHDEITGVIPVADVVEGRFGVYTSHSFTYDFGSQTDLPGFKVPATAEEANNARQLITWAVDNRPFPLYQPIPSYTWALRGGFDQSVQTPASVTLYLTHPGNQESVTIPSGTPALAFGKGVYTIPSGGYIYHASLGVYGALIQVANTAEDGASDAGKAKYLATYSDRKVGTVRYYDSSTGKLTVELD
jgi:hypothetical protein